MRVQKLSHHSFLLQRSQCNSEVVEFNSVVFTNTARKLDHHTHKDNFITLSYFSYIQNVVKNRVVGLSRTSQKNIVPDLYDLEGGRALR